MEFFKIVSELISDGQQINMTIRKVRDELAVSVIPDKSGVKDKALDKIQPVVLTGTPEDFEDGFRDAFQHLTASIGLVSNVKDYEDSVEEARKLSEMAKKEKDEKDRLKKEFQGYISLAKQNLSEDKFLDAKRCLAKAEEVKDADRSIIDRLKKEISERSGEGNMFGGPIDKSDGKNINPSKAKNIPQEDNKQSGQEKCNNDFEEAMGLSDDEDNE